MFVCGSRDLDSEFGSSFRGAAVIGDPNPRERKAVVVVVVVGV